MRFEVLTAAKMSMLVFRVVTPCELLGSTNVSEEYTIFSTLNIGTVCSSQKVDVHL
jgi:hypothetical protein